MLVKVFTLYDSVAKVYLRPFCMVTTGEAVRGFITTLNDPNSDLSKYPADFTLFETGTFDDETGQIVQYLIPENLGNGLHMKGKWQQIQNEQNVQERSVGNAENQTEGGSVIGA